ncbi:MAG: MAPEG family protein [Asticcacaulis sp.]
MIEPVLGLIVWSLIVLIWLYARRIPAIIKLRLNPQSLADKRNFRKLPVSAQNVAENYNHLMEQPTLFYALCLAIHLSGYADRLFLVLGWIYVGLRVAHTLIQAFGNKIVLRSFIFASGSGILIYMTARTVRLVFDF